MGLKTLLYTVLIVLLGMLCPVSAPAGEVINITSGEWGPYLSSNLPDGGLAARIVTAAFAEVGVKVNYGYFPWKRSYKYVRDGRDGSGMVWHASVIWVHTDERARDFLFSDSVVDDDEVLFSLRSNPVEWETVEDLEGKSIGGTLHTVYPLFEEAYREGVLTLYRASNYDMLFERLLQRRIDAVPQVRRVGMYYLITTLSKADMERITYSPTVVQTRRYKVMFSRKVEGNVRLLRLFNQGLARLRRSGAYDRLLNSKDYDMFRLKTLGN